MKMSNKTVYGSSLLASALAAAVFSVTSAADEPPVVKERQVVVIVNDDGDEKEINVIAVKGEDSEAPKYWMGIGLKDVTGDLAEYLGSDDGVLVSSVYPDSPSAKADIKEGDVLVTVNGKALAGPASLLEILKNLPQPKDGDAVESLKVALLRKGKEITVELTPAGRPKELMAKRVQIAAADDAHAGAATIIGNLKGKSAEEIREWIERSAAGKDAASFFRFGAPSAIWLGDGKASRLEGNINAVIVSEDDGKKVEVTIEREGDGPAKIKVKEGDDTKEYTEKQIGDLAERVQQLVRPMLQNGNRFQFRMNALGGKPADKGDEAKKNDDDDGDEKSAENRTQRRERIAVFDKDVELPNWFNEREMANHFRKMADEFSKKYKDSSKWAQDAAAVPAELKELREQVEKLRDEIQSLRSQLNDSKKRTDTK